MERLTVVQYRDTKLDSDFPWYTITVPVLVIVAGDPSSMLFVRSVIVWMNDLVVVSLIFGNIMYSVHVGSKSASGSIEEDKAQIEAAVRRYHHSSNPATGNPHTKAAATTGPAQVSSLSSTAAPPKISTTCSSSLGPLRPLSSLSMESGSNRKSVSFSDNIMLSEIPVRECHNNINVGSQRFVTEGTQGAPLKPRRSFADDVMLQPDGQSPFTADTSPASTPRSLRSCRRLSLDSCIPSNRIVEASSRRYSGSHSTSDREWHSGPVQGSPVTPRRRSIDDITMMQPCRQPSEHLDDSEGTACGEDLGLGEAVGREAILPQGPMSSLMHVATLPLCETTAAESARHQLPAAALGGAAYLHQSHQSTFQTSGQSSGQGTAFRPDNNNIVASHPRQPVRVLSTAKLESECDSDDEVLLVLGAPNLERKSSRGSVESDPTPPTKPERIMSSIPDSDSEDSSDDEAKFRRARVPNGATSKPSRIAAQQMDLPRASSEVSSKRVPVDSIIHDLEYGWKHDAKARVGSPTDSSGHVQGAPTQPLRLESTVENDPDEEGGYRPVPVSKPRR